MAACGLAIIGWVIYNSLIRRLPEYTGGFLTFGLGPIMVFFTADQRCEPLVHSLTHH